MLVKYIVTVVTDNVMRNIIGFCIKTTCCQQFQILFHKFFWKKIVGLFHSITRCQHLKGK